LVTPDLRALAVELRSQREETNCRFDDANKPIADLTGEMRGAFACPGKNGGAIDPQLQLDQRLGKLEEENQSRKQLPENQ
jgi:hypothetical protein